MKTVFVTLLMIGIAMTGCGQSKPKIAIPAGQFDAATFKGPWPTKKVDCIDLGSNYFYVRYQDGTELHFADSRPNRDVPPIPDPLPPDVDNADLCSELHADKPAKPSAKKGAPFTCSVFGEEWTMGKDGVCHRPPPPPTDVPAIRKTDNNHSDTPGFCSYYKKHPDRDNRDKSGIGSICIGDYEYWTCPDPDAYSLQVSVSGKNANCHRIAP